MAGGDAADIERAMPVFDALRPDGDRADSFVHVGGIGAGHYAKMVHNGIEYGLMQAYAEGYELLPPRTSSPTFPARSVPGRREPLSGPGCWTLWSRPSTRTPAWNQSTTTSRIPARAAGRWKRPSPTPSGTGHHGSTFCPLLLPRGQLPGHEDGFRAAPPVRRACDPSGQVVLP